ncbi:MAG TPA: amidohydrolase family protein, partial [Chloroflexota bacterium]|nr:amidohydrolase family protein [Chloroflexota bacterium]
MVDPWRGKAGARDAQRLIDLGARGFKFHPLTQAFFPSERRFYELYEVLAANKVPALFHTGQTAVGQGAPGGGGVHLKYGNPMYLDDVAVDFPDMPIIMAHPSFPWQDEALSVALHKPQVYIDLSGWSPKYFPPQLVQYANTLLKNKVLFGSDHPMITTDRWLADSGSAGFREEVMPLILKENAARLLGLRTS